MIRFDAGALMRAILVVAVWFVAQGSDAAEFPAQDRAIGEREHPRLVRAFGGAYESHPGLLGYVTEIGERVAEQSPYSDQEWVFTILDTPLVNAFALPGGRVYLTRGILALARSEAEIAFVVAHEIAHVVARHSAARNSRRARRTIWSEHDKAPQQASQHALLDRFDQRDELEADSIALRYLRAAGYDPEAALRILLAQESHTRLTGWQARPGDPRTSSHPSTPERVKQVETLVQASEGAAYMGGRERYLAAIDGLPFGERPGSMLVRDGEVFARGSGVRFTMPEGFRIRAGPGRVVARARDGTLLIYDEIAAGWEDRVHGFLPRGSREVELLRFNGMDAATGIRNRERKGFRFEFRTLVIQCAAGRICRFRYVVPVAKSLTRHRDLLETAQSFRKFNTEDHWKARPHAIEVVTVGANDTLDSMVARMALGTASGRWFELLNDLVHGELPPIGTRLKLVTHRDS